MAVRVVTVERPARPRAMDTLGPLAIVRGLVVTASHFFRNLFGFIRGKPTIFTVQYPEEVQKVSSAFRGMPVLVQMANGKERCVACGLCEWACPVDCITIYPAETEDDIEHEVEDRVGDAAQQQHGAASARVDRGHDDRVDHEQDDERRAVIGPP